MDQTLGLNIYCLAGGNKFKLVLPQRLISQPVADLKTYICHERKFPVECQVVFICQGDKMVDLSDDKKIPDPRKDATTIHVYMKKSAQNERLEKTRQSDYEEWHAKFKELKMTANYGGGAPNQMRETRKSTCSQSDRSSSVLSPVPLIHGGGTSGDQNPLAEVQSTIRRTITVSAVRGRSYNAESDHCQSCYRKDKHTRPTHYCFSCEHHSCVLCEDCANENHPEVDHGHDISLYQPSNQRAQMHQQAQLEPAARRVAPPVHRPEPEGWNCVTCTTRNLPHRLQCLTCYSPRPAHYVIPAGYKPTAEEMLLLSLMVDSSTLRWKCTVCTFDNLPHRPSCELCSKDRPADFHIPEDYVPTAEENEFLNSTAAARHDVEQVLEEERREQARAREQNRLALLNTDEQSVVPNDEAFECTICYVECEAGEGVKLRECLHLFCRDCLKGHIESSETPEVRCPFLDDAYQCDEVIQEREIKTIAPDFHPRLLERGLQLAESQAQDSFHCKSLNCVGWCTYDDDVNFFQCPVCNVKNCLTCQAIHEDMDCKEYQDDIKRKAEIDVEARQTQDELERLLNTNEAMKCPKCQIIIMKKTGCDWIKCSVCHTEICWVTKQARWGPGGVGDTSGGCKCDLFNNRPCHRQCGNCH